MSKVNYRPHKKNLRLDLTLYNLGFTESRAKAIDLIKQGKVFVNSKIVKKNSYLINKEDKIYVKKDVKQWVSRGAIKLLYALEKFDLDETGNNVAMSAFTDFVGFMILALSIMPLFVTFGVIMAVMIFLSFIAAVIMLPALLYQFGNLEGNSRF